ncbi:Aste57867_477 [Aphanomyces stellatus]|uniref:GPI ethanolamine phosphate transferase 1 n=1 Tax=Aphanomyces stellatus TaxID=120398 RepID=A0A485K2R1_9STRA|nr:hypothetical protein As57867_000476 [Aphanomyces stellatus]VFT77702.1 Aste57867_477 [Aphanomyces stellatus]
MLSPMSSSAAWPTGLLALGTLFHAIYVLSIFDIYFKSPVVHNIPTIEVLHASYPPPAKRLVIFIADGCRADKFFEANDSYAVFAHNRLKDANLSSLVHSPYASHEDPTRAPFLRHAIKHWGSWGVSHTGVPTESRPGHVAMFAGMYEDVSAVTRGWHENPVDFDSIFNQSSHAWLYGSPDIVPMFAKNVEHAHEKHYSSAEEDFAKDATVLDTWVYRKFEALLDEARTNRTLYDQLHSNKVLFFFHFLGIDTNGHAHRPHSHEYLANVALVDRLVEGIHTMLEGPSSLTTRRLIYADFFKDNQTSYIFSADHGMSHQGSHGDGAPANTRTPLVVWGAGVQPPTTAAVATEDKGGFHMDVPSHSHNQVFAQLDAHVTQEADALREWNLESLVRKDVLQADIAPLAAALLGLPYPRNSVGVLPFSYLQQGLYRARAVAFNAQSLYTHAAMKQREKREATFPLFFRAFPPLDDCPALLATIERAFGAKAYADIESLSQKIIGDALAGLRHFQRYDWLLLMSIITLGYVGWMLVLYVAVAQWPFSVASLVRLPNGSFDTGVIVWVGVGSVSMFVYNHSATPMYYLYLVFPLVFWRFLFREYAVFMSQPRLGLGVLVLVAISIELIVWGYSVRSVFSALCLVVGLYPNIASGYDGATARLWLGGCLLLSIFPLVPVDYGDDLNLVLAGGSLWLVLGVVLYWQCYPLIHGSSLIFILAALVSLVGTMNAIAAKDGSAAVGWIYSNWIIAVGSFGSLFVIPHQTLQYRLMQIMLAVSPFFLLLSISYEVFFYAFFCLTLLLWIRLENKSSKPSSTASFTSGVSAEDVRLALWYLVFFKLSFFATGNIASMSSFEISSTFRFVTVFNPFIMGGLLVLKILLPMVIVTCAFHVLLTLRGRHPNRLFLLVVLLSDILALHFFFLVRDEGSWKEIGNSISIFGIVNIKMVFIPLLLALAKACFQDAKSTSDLHID